MELSKVISDRRSIRKYNDKEITKEEIKDILNHGILSPSAKNRQPWHFIVIHEDKKLKESIADTLLQKTNPSVEMTSNAIKESSALILVYGDINDDIWDIQSIGACIQNILLRATDLGIASLWIGYILKIEEELKEMVSCDKRLIAAITLGHTDTVPNPRPRKTLEEVSVWY